MNDREAHEAGFRNGWIVKCAGRDVRFFTTRKAAEEYQKGIVEEYRTDGWTARGAASRGCYNFTREAGHMHATVLKKVVDGKAQFV